MIYLIRIGHVLAIPVTIIAGALMVATCPVWLPVVYVLTGDLPDFGESEGNI